MLTNAQLAVIKAELTTDPLGNGYAGLDDVEAAAKLNEKVRLADRESLTAVEIVSAIDETEYNALAARAKEYVGLILAAGGINLNALTKTQLGSIFGAGTATRANLLAELKRTGTRGEELAVGMITPSDIADAKRLP